MLLIYKSLVVSRNTELIASATMVSFIYSSNGAGSPSEAKSWSVFLPIHTLILIMHSFLNPCSVCAMLRSSAISLGILCPMHVISELSVRMQTSASMRPTALSRIKSGSGLQLVLQSKLLSLQFSLYSDRFTLHCIEVLSNNACVR